MNQTLMFFQSRLTRLLGLTLAVLVVAAAGAGSASAHNDECGLTEANDWHCSWYDPEQASGAKHWFSAATTLRSWFSASVTGNSGYYVTQKCVHVTRGSDGAELQVACGWGYQSGGIASNWRPGYLWTRHGASGTRWIHGNGWH